MRLLAALVLLAAAGCGISSQITRSSTRTFTPKDPGCNVEFFRTQRPAVPYDEIAAIHLASGVIHGPQDAQEKLRVEACGLGADAVIVTEELYQVPSVGLRVTGTAVAYRKDSTPMNPPMEKPAESAPDAGTQTPVSP